MKHFVKNKQGEVIAEMDDGEPEPIPPHGIEAIVCRDIAERQKRGIQKYGVSVAENPLQLRDWLNHAYEETLDKAVYLRRAIAEIDKDPTTGLRFDL